eukprot:GGOE01014081.1.p1 GENE.GGOE01014081.1~~GGOE01014081.1.p1  ORF type:complete len:396 (-),score=59.06 GGOE01014081.1:174-1265(-)
MKQSSQVRTIGCGGVITYQLLCGRDIANPREAAPQQRDIFSAASGMANYVYLVVNEEDRTAFAIDAAWDVDGLYKFADALGVNIVGGIYTHSHFDHCGGVVDRMMTGGQEVVLPGAQDVVKRSGKVWVAVEDAERVKNQCRIPSTSITTVCDGDVIAAGDLMLHAVHTPGHTPGSMCLFVNPSTVSPPSSEATFPRAIVDSKAGVLITGDTLFVGSCGRTDLPGSDQSQMFRSLSRLSGLAPGVTVLPGHHYAAEPFSTIQQERGTNQMMAVGLKYHPQPPALPPCCAHGHGKLGPLKLIVGCRVQVASMDGEANADIIGKVGLIRGFQEAKGLYEVQLVPPAKPAVVELKPTHLQPLAYASL